MHVCVASGPAAHHAIKLDNAQAIHLARNLGELRQRAATNTPRSPGVYAVIADVAAYAGWLEGVSRVERLEVLAGRVRFRQHSSTGPLVMEVQEASPSSRFVTRIADADQPFDGTWTFELTPESAGTRVTICGLFNRRNPLS